MGGFREHDADRRARRAFLRDVGKEDHGLHLGDPDEARAELTRAGGAALARCRRRLARSFLHDRPQLEAAAAVGELDPASRVVIYPAASAMAPRWLVHTLGGRPTTDPFLHQAEVPELRSYMGEGEDPFADRPVALGPLVAGHAVGDPMVAVERLLLPNHVLHQLRMVIYQRRQASLFVGLYRSPGEPPFDRELHARLLAARPALRTWARVADAIGGEPLGGGALTVMLAALEEPALLVRRRRVVFANVAGRGWVDATREWLGQGSPGGFGTVTALAPRGLEVDLVLPRAPPAADGLAALPPSLQKVGTLLSRGLADKEIARAVGMPLATVRTYVARVLKRLDVRGRRELMLRLRGSDPADD